MSPYRKPVRLSNRIGEYSDEPLMALVNRRAVQTGMENIAEVWKFVGGLPSGPEPFRQILAAVPRLAPLRTVNRVLWATPRVHGRHIQLMGNSYRREQIDRTNIRWCPHCLKKEPYFRAIWTIKAYTHCAVHEIPLRASCAECGKAQRWPRSGKPHNISVCQCGSRFDRIEAERLDERACRSIDKWIFENAPASESFYRKRAWSEELLTDGMPYHQVLECFSRLGAYALAPSTPHCQTLDGTEISELMTRGLECASGYSFFQLLSKIADANYVETDSGVAKSPIQRLVAKYGQIAEWLLSKRTSAPFERMIDELLTHNRTHDIVVHPGFEFTYLPSGEFVSLDNISKKLGIKIESAWKHLVRFGYVVPYDMPGDFQLPKHVLDRLLEPVDVHLSYPVDAHLSYKELAASLSVSKDSARELLLAGCISEDPKRAASRKLVVKKLQVEELLLRLDSRHQSGRESEALVPLSKARTPFTSRADLVKLVLDGKLPVRKIERGRRGLDRYMLAADEIERIFLAEKRAIKMPEAIRLLSMNEGEIKILISRGHISTSMTGSQRLLNNSDVNSCLRKFVGERKAMKELEASRSLIAKAVSSFSQADNFLLRDGDHVVFTRRGYESIQVLLDARFGAQLKLAI
jgi:hypothetical protein